MKKDMTISKEEKRTLKTFVSELRKALEGLCEVARELDEYIGNEEVKKN